MAALLLSGMAVSAQGVMFVYDPYRHAIVSANNNSSLKRFERIGNLKMDVIANKEKTAANYMEHSGRALVCQGEVLEQREPGFHDEIV